MKISERDRRALMILGPALLITAIVYFWPEPSSAPVVVDTATAIETARTRLDHARATAAQLSPRVDAKKTVDANLAVLEKRLIPGDTPAQAQAQLLQIFRRVARIQGPSVEIRGNDIGSASPAGAYTEVALNVAFDCQVEGLVNLMTDLSAQPELLTWRDLRIASPDSKQKRINVSMLLLGYAPGKLIPKPAGAPRA